MSRDTIKVIARFRPQNALEIENNSSSLVSFDSEDTCRITSKDFSGSFTFDRVFPPDSAQEDIFNYSIKSTVDDILSGYNGTVLAYGQTGSGKSYTMMGPSIDDPQSCGLIPRIVKQIFASILTAPDNIEYTVRVSYMEIYMERVKDLLNIANDNLPVHEDKSRGVYIKGLTETYVASVEEVFEVMRQGARSRAVASTNMNQESSRSHAIFSLVVSQKNLETGSSKSGQLFLVDLAGSEKVGKTGASGQTLEEAKKINKSLSTLGMVINSLTDSKSSHIPYRDSKLTRILQESLGGNSRTSLIINCSPSSYNDQETISTLRFGARAKNIRNKAKINAELSATELKLLLRTSQQQLGKFAHHIRDLQSELTQWRDGKTPDASMWVSFIDALGAHASSATNSKVKALDTADTDASVPGSPATTATSNNLNGSIADDDSDYRSTALQQEVDKKTRELNEVREAFKDLVHEMRHLKLHSDSMDIDDSAKESSDESSADELLLFDDDDANLPYNEIKNEQLAKFKSWRTSEEFTRSKIRELHEEISRKDKTIDEMHQKIRKLDEMSKISSAVQSAELGPIPDSNEDDLHNSKLKEFEAIKKALMVEVEKRCERVVELEIQLDETREQYDKFMKTSGSAQQKKMLFLNRNLEHLTQVQRQLVEQNSHLKKEIAVAERKLNSRNERIEALETLLQFSQEKLAADSSKFETRLDSIRSKLEEAQMHSSSPEDRSAVSSTP
ncbi:hypothetical protein CANCADRAFT_43901 [Tortispora caseinolytica NRRL Y-17796]|uniref:Kinesin-like protein n=1 Tax=Tortispora caseinolytica NRRL Y-17796 TaxID=767744 RepID=A0A1E4TEP7_9ASCO|nr:hypothetical protein CANCADRAFT_43901 [Tortispora caseinolytica NRRL Y-17796]